MIAIPATEKKLREVHFFFDHLLRAKDRFPAETEQAEFFLSAFLSAARSVTWVLQAEQKTLYDNWFRTWLAGRLSEVVRPVLHFEINETVGEEVTTECQCYLALLDALVSNFREARQD